MKLHISKGKLREWLERYLFAELAGLSVAFVFATVTFARTHSYLIATGTGLVGEGIGFYGFFVTRELLIHGKTYQHLPWLRRVLTVVGKTGAGMVVEFAPAEFVDKLFVRPFMMYFVPQHLHPYALGFTVGVLLADAVFYSFAISGYELLKRTQRG